MESCETFYNSRIYILRWVHWKWNLFDSNKNIAHQFTSELVFFVPAAILCHRTFILIEATCEQIWYYLSDLNYDSAKCFFFCFFWIKIAATSGYSIKIYRDLARDQFYIYDGSISWIKKYRQKFYSKMTLPICEIEILKNNYLISPF